LTKLYTQKSLNYKHIVPKKHIHADGCSNVIDEGAPDSGAGEWGSSEQSTLTLAASCYTGNVF